MTPQTRRAAFILGALILGGGAAMAGAPSPVPTPTPVTLELSPQPGDSVRIVARWRLTCDTRGCADSSRVTWTVGTRTIVRSTRQLVDTIRLAAPPWPDSVRVSVAVAAVRRGLVGESRVTSYVVRARDAAPPVPDSLRVDTTAAYAADVYEDALADSFPVKVVRAVTGDPLPPTWTLPVGTETPPACVLGRNRFTGEVRMFVPADVPDGELAAIDQACARARDRFALERAG